MDGAPGRRDAEPARVFAVCAERSGGEGTEEGWILKNEIMLEYLILLKILPASHPVAA